MASFSAMTHNDPMAGFPVEVFRRRRERALQALEGGVMVLPAAPILHRSADTEHRYRPDSELFYLTGCTEPGSVAVLMGGAERRFVLFVRERDEEAELWAGPRLGPEGAEERFGADETHPMSELDEVLPRLLGAGDRIHHRLGRGDVLERLVVEALGRARRRGRRTGSGPRGVVDPGEILDELRVVKDEHEIRTLRSAAWISTEGHRAGFEAVAPGRGEWEVEAVVDAAFRGAGASGPGYPTIVGSGANACVLHYVENRHTIDAGDLVLVDAGAELNLYQGDVSRTVPATGRFTERQRAVYDVVEAARRAALDAVAPGATVGDVNAAAVGVVVDGLVDLGILSGAREDLVAEEAHKPWFPHQTSHWLGIDVHDPADYARDGASRTLEPGMVFTVEPGLYFPPGSEGPAAAFAGTGVRIEDDVLVTEDGHENLTRSLPTDPEAVEALVGEGA